MKRQVRKGVFETNSSSTHSLTICSLEEYERWKNGEILFDTWTDEFVEPKNVTLDSDEKEEVKKKYNKKKQKYWKDWEELTDKEKEELYLERIEEKKSYHNLETHEEYFDDEYLETFIRQHTTPNGEKVVAFGKYGYDG